MIKKQIFPLCCAIAAALSVQMAKAQFTMTDAGAANPTPGANDVYLAFPPNPQNNDGLNYYWDAGSSPGQTFTTGSNSGGYTLTNLAIRTAGNGGGWGSGPNSWSATQTFTLTIYSVDGSNNATPIVTNTAVGALTAEGDWMQWSGLSVPLLPNTNYAYTFKNGDTASGGNWEQLANNGNNPYARGQICAIPQGGGAVSFGSSGVSDGVFDIGLALGTVSGGTVTISDIGTAAPTPGPNDISQLLPLPSTLPPPQNDYGVNYYWDNANPPGQTFTTPNSTMPWVMTNVFIKTGGGGGGWGGQSQFNNQTFVVRIYSVTGGTNATLLQTYSAPGALVTEGDWLQFSGMGMILQPNTQYAYTLGKNNTNYGGNWEHMLNYSGNHYSGGKICTIPTAGGAIGYGTQTSTNFSDAGFDVGLAVPLVFAATPTYSPNVNPIYAGTTVTLNGVVVGQPTISYQWQTDGGSGTFTNIPAATSSNLVVNTTSLLGTINYQLIATTTAGGGASSTSSPVALSIVAASAPIIVSDTTASPNTTTNFVGFNQSFSASFAGTLPIAYQWFVASGSAGTGATIVPGATNTTLTLANLQLSNSGYYALVASNAVSPYNTTSTWAQLTVVPASQLLIRWLPPVTFNGLTAGQILTNTLPGTFFEAAHFGTDTGIITVTVNGVAYDFYGDGSKVSQTGASGTFAGAFSGTTGDANLDSVFNQFTYEAPLTLTLSNLVVGNRYCVQLFSVDDRGLAGSRYTSFQDAANAADVSATVGPLNANMYVIGTFTAPSTNIVIQQNLVAGNGGNINAVIVGTSPNFFVPPQLNITRSGQTMTLSWPFDHVGYQLYTNSVGLSATNSWYPMPGTASATNQTVTVSPNNPQVFFQLRYP